MNDQRSQSRASLCTCGHSRGWHMDTGRCGLDGCKCAAFEAACPEEGVTETSQSIGETSRFKVSYTYNSPGPAGPFKGRMVLDRRYSRGEFIRAPFGGATVVSCRAVQS